METELENWILQDVALIRGPRRFCESFLFSWSRNWTHLALFVFEELNLPQALLCFFNRLVRASQVPAFARNNFVAAFHSYNHGTLPTFISLDNTAARPY